jgi:membrane protein DedA with SNARE-associated domain
MGKWVRSWESFCRVVCIAIVAAGIGVGYLSAGFGGEALSCGEAKRNWHHGHTPAIQWVVGHLETAAAKAQPLLERYGYAAVFFSILPEGFGIPAPGQTILMAASLDAAEGRLSISWVVAYGCVAATLGNVVGYLIGRWGGRPLLRRIRVNEAHLQGIEGRFVRHGTGILLIARFFDGLRQLNGIVAGLLGMPWRTFAVLNALGAVLWTASWGLVVYFIGKRIASVHILSAKAEPALLFLALAFLVVLAVYVLWHRRGKRVPKQDSLEPPS